MNELLEQLKRYGFVDGHGHPLENCTDFHKIVARLAQLEEGLRDLVQDFKDDTESAERRYEYHAEHGKPYLYTSAEQERAVYADFIQRVKAILAEPPCGHVGFTSNGLISVVCSRTKGHSGNHAGMGCEWNDAAGKVTPAVALPRMLKEEGAD